MLVFPWHGSPDPVYARARALCRKTFQVGRCSSTLLQVWDWVEEARGPDRDELQWQKYEDTATGYWLTYTPFVVR